MDIVMWPVVGRERLIGAFQPQADVTSEAPYRTLRRHDWASMGRRLSVRNSGRITQQYNLFSSLNMDAARLARRGFGKAAVHLATEAARLETGPLFDRFTERLAQFSMPDIHKVIGGWDPHWGTMPLAGSIQADSGDAHYAGVAALYECLVCSPQAGDTAGTGNQSRHELSDVLRTLAEATFAVRTQVPELAQIEHVVSGWVSGTDEYNVAITNDLANPTARQVVPRWLADGVDRSQTGAALYLVHERFHGARTMVEALPGIVVLTAQSHRQMADAKLEPPAAPFDPFARPAANTYELPESATGLLSTSTGLPEILIPVDVE